MVRKRQPQYESPDISDPASGEQPGGAEFAEYEVPGDERAMSLAASDTEVESFLLGVDSQLMAAKLELEKLLDSVHSRGLGIQSEESLATNIVGVGVGLGSGRTDFGDADPGDPVLEIYTIEPEAPREAKARLAAAAGVSAMASDDFPVHVVHTGIIDAYPHRFRERPAPGGISVGHKAITAGTLGVLTRGNSAPRNNRLMILSNNHVLANVNAGAIGDAILQPGPFDGGVNPADQVAVLERFIPINFAPGSTNVVDCATGWAWPARVRKELVYVQAGVKHYFRVGTAPVTATPGLRVGKTGRTTQLTSGTITAVGVTINVNYGGGRVARFIDQVAVRAAGGDFSQGGDSGSLIWTWDARRAPVALLFAGGGGTTFGNRIPRVLAALDVQIVA